MWKSVALRGPTVTQMPQLLNPVTRGTKIGNTLRPKIEIEMENKMWGYEIQGFGQLF
jgi:hypothetical protein